MKKCKMNFINILLSILFLSTVCYNVNALTNIDFGNYSTNKNYEDYDDEDSLKRENIKTETSEIYKGFMFTTYFEIPKNAPANFVDIINKSLRNMAVNNIPDKYIKENNVGLLFKIFDLEMKENKCYSNSYVLAKSEKKRNKMIKLYREGMSGDINDKSYFSVLPMNEEEYKEYIKEYIRCTYKKLKNFVKLLENLYEKKEKEKLKKILKLHYKDMAHSENVLSYMNQSKDMKKLIGKMLDCLGHENNKKTKNKKKNDLFLKEDYDDLDELDIDNDDDDEIEEDFDFDVKKFNREYYFEKCLKTYYKIGIKNIKKLKKIDYDEYRRCMSSVVFKKKLKPVTRKKKKISGYIETIEKK